MRSRPRSARLCRPEPSRGPPAPPPAPVLPLASQKNKKRGGKVTGGGAGGGGQEPQVPGRKFHGRGRGVPRSSSLPPPKIIWKLLPISSGTSNTFLHFQADKALSRESLRLPSGKREGSQRAPLPQTPSRSARNHRSDGCHRRPTGRLGLQGAWPRRAPALLRARLVLRWIPVFMFDLFFIL